MARKPKPSGRKRLPDKGRPLGRRQVDVRPPRPRFLIVCEGSKTEPNYFRRFRINRDVVDLEVKGLGDHTLSLVQRTCELMQQDDYAQVWCVFDRDSFPAERFNQALNQAQQHDIQTAYSNQAFELWYLLHFDYHDTTLSRTRYQQMLTKRLGKPYQKNAPNMYALLKERQKDAIRNARRLLDSYGPDHNPERDNPSTTVHQLVEELNRYVR